MQTEVSLEIVLALIVLIAAFISYAIHRIRKRERIVEETSIMLKNLLEINSYYFYNFDWSVQKQYKFHMDLQSKGKFERYNLMDLFDDNVLNNSDLMQAPSVIKHNKKIYIQYLRAISVLKSEITKEQAKKLRISQKKYIEIEKKLFFEKKIHPVLECNIVCTASYSSPKGRNHYSKTETYSVDIIPQRSAILQQEMENQNSEEMRRKRARSQMTDKLRYRILKRDGFRCKLCGRTANDGVKLHVDHIIPVSKGGETVPENLRTLCDACNLGKSDEIE